MDTNKRKFEWPEHSTWWDRNEKKVNIVLWGILILLLIIARALVKRGLVNIKIAVIWSALFFLVTFILSFVTTR